MQTFGNYACCGGVSNGGHTLTCPVGTKHKTPKRDVPKTHRTRVYVCGPINGSGRVTLNVRRAVEVASVLLKRGYAPYVPHLNCLWEMATPTDFSIEEWLSLDFEFLGACDVLLRLPGDSPGSDREVALAMKMGIPVFLSLDTLIAAHPPTYSLA